MVSDAVSETVAFVLPELLQEVESHNYQLFWTPSLSADSMKYLYVLMGEIRTQEICARPWQLELTQLWLVVWLQVVMSHQVWHSTRMGSS